MWAVVWRLKLQKNNCACYDMHSGVTGRPKSKLVWWSKRLHHPPSPSLLPPHAPHEILNIAIQSTDSLYSMQTEICMLHGCAWVRGIDWWEREAKKLSAVYSLLSWGTILVDKGVLLPYTGYFGLTLVFACYHLVAWPCGHTVCTPSFSFYGSHALLWSTV